MPSHFWTPNVSPPRDAEPVNANTAGRSVEQLRKRTEFLKDAYDNVSNTSGRLIKAEASMDPEAVPGDILYYDSRHERYSKALAGLEADATDEVPSPLASSYAVGLCLTSDSAGSGSVLISGMVNPEEFNFDPSDMLDSGVRVNGGYYYLSRTIPGRISATASVPEVVLGYFSANAIFFCPLLKRPDQAHYHLVFDLQDQPASSQNFLKTGWGTNGDNKLVDYFNNGSDDTSPEIIMSVRTPRGLDLDEDVRVEVYNTGLNKMGVQLKSGSGLDITDPTSGPTSDSLASIDWPEYGEWTAIGDTGLEVSFLRKDQVYDTALVDDAADLLTATTDRFKIYLPDDIVGWTNPNFFDFGVPANAMQAYVIRGGTRLGNAFPPLPPAAANLDMDGIALHPEVDFRVTAAGIFWLKTEDETPWPENYSQADHSDPVAIWFRISFASVNYDSINQHNIIDDGAVGTIQLADGAVTEDKLDDDAVTADKIADNAVGNEHLQDDSVGNDEMQDDAIGTAEIQNDAVNGSKIAADSIASQHFKNSSVTASAIAAAAVTASKYASRSIASSKIKLGAVGTPELAQNAVTDANLASDSVTTSKVVDEAIVTSKVADEAITEEKIAEEAVTAEKLGPLVLTVPIGMPLPIFGTTLPAGRWLWVNGETIGDASSGATARANSDTLALFTQLWGGSSNTELQLYTSAGATNTRGGSAAADFAAHRRLALPDLRGLVIAGRDNMGGTASAVLDNLTPSIANTTLGAVGGTPDHAHTSENMVARIIFNEAGSSDIRMQTRTDPEGSYVENRHIEVTTTGTAGAATNPTSGAAVHGATDQKSSLQPTILLNYIIGY